MHDWAIKRSNRFGTVLRGQASRLALRALVGPIHNSTGHYGLWTSDGTIAGTTEVGGLGSGKISGANSNFDPTGLLALGSDVFFNADDSSGDQGLWVSNGTATGTFEVGGLKDASVSGVGAYGLEPSLITTVGSKVLFWAYDSSATYEYLWVSDGTTAGTTELGGTKNAGISGAYFNGLSAQNFATLGNKLVFTALDSNDYRGLWVTDGTTAGTVEIGGLRNAGVTGVNTSTYGYNISSYVRLGSKLVFNWVDSSGDTGLWVTDGTAAGTYEIGGVANQGVLGAYPYGFSYAPQAELGGKILFKGEDSAYYDELWVTDGTAAGTIEIGGVGGGGLNGGSAFNLYPSGVTVFGNRAVFNGDDPSNHYGLWVTDGTTAGTFEIGGLASAGVTNARIAQSSGLDPQYFVSLGNKVLFEAYDASNQLTLWVTDGTLAGTTEIGGLNNAGVSGAASGGLYTSDFVADGGIASFHANNSSNSNVLWVSDGTAAGTYQITGVTGQNSYGLNSSNLYSLSAPSAASNPPDDFTGAGVSNVIWQYAPNGSTYEWTMTAGQHTGDAFLGALPGWSIIGNGDFNGDGSSDLLWQYQATGAVYEWQMVNGQHAGDVYLGNLSGWTATTGDFNGDGTSDIIWQNNASGATYEWTMSNGQHAADTYLGTLPGWKIVASGDFDGDGTSDLIWQNQSTGATYEWLMTNGQHTGDVYLGNLNSWSVVGTGDYTGSGVDNIVWRSQTNGATYEWQMSGGQHVGTDVSLGNLAPSSWTPS